MDDDTTIPPRDPINHRRNETKGQGRDGSHAHFASLGIGQEFDALDALTECIEYGRTTIEQRAPILSRRDPLAVAVEQAHAKDMLQLRD